MSLKLKNIDFNNQNLLNNILIWRNDNNTRINSLNTNIITEEIFSKIIDKYKESDICPLIIYNQNIEVGIITFVKENNEYYIGINIDPNERNKGIAKKALEILLSESVLDNKKIIAKIKKTNLSSIKLFKQYFEFYYEDDIFINYYYLNKK